MSNRIKVVGYAQKVVYDGSIEYRNFTPDLVGVQLASNNGTPLFTMGNFSITTNMDTKLNKLQNTAKFSNFITLSDLDLTLEQTKTLLTDNAGVLLNLDKGKLDYYSLFGSLSEFVRVSLENIIINWPASLYLKPVSQTPAGKTIVGYTVEDYSYNQLTEVASFKVNTTFINNKFQLIYTNSGNILETYNATNSLRNVTSNYNSYAILYKGTEYPLIAFTAATYETNDYIYLDVKGNPFSGTQTSLNAIYHIKPSKLNEEKFFNTLPDFEFYLLNRNVTPIYTATFKYPIKSDDGLILYITDKVTWPVSDGYNIDFDTTDYIDYATRLLDISNKNDLISSNLMTRFLVSESISDFDTTPVHLSDLDQDTSGQKVNKTLQIYGREYDEINKFIIGIEFANTVTYDKQDNTPDIYLKNLARVLGWELVSSVLENNLLASYVTTKPSTYSGQSVGLTAVEADTELWRRLILNSPWLWKSKGARKSIEFLLKFIGAPQGLVKFNEYIYKANAPIDVDLFAQVLTLNGLNNDITQYPIDQYGYPRPFPNTPDMYFQNNGLWYRETGGSGSTIDILTGNNPHLGPYDGGFKYLNQFTCLIPNFSAVTISSETTTTNTLNLYTNYDLGKFNIGVTTATTVDTVYITNEDGSDIGNCVVFVPSIKPDPNPSPVLNDCGCVCEAVGGDKVMSLCVESNPYSNNKPACSDKLASSPVANLNNGFYNFSYYQYDINGNKFIINGLPVLVSSQYTSKECCRNIGGIPFIYNEGNNGRTINSGYVCCTTNKCGCTIACDWMVDLSPIVIPSGGTASYLQFNQPNGTKSVVTPDGCNCIGSGYTNTVPNILDPYTGQVGYGCQLTQNGLTDLSYGQLNSIIYYNYLNRVTSKTSCYDFVKK